MITTRAAQTLLGDTAGHERRTKNKEQCNYTDDGEEATTSAENYESSTNAASHTAGHERRTNCKATTQMVMDIRRQTTRRTTSVTHTLHGDTAGHERGKRCNKTTATRARRRTIRRGGGYESSANAARPHSWLRTKEKITLVQL